MAVLFCKDVPAAASHTFRLVEFAKNAFASFYGWLLFRCSLFGHSLRDSLRPGRSRRLFQETSGKPADALAVTACTDRARQSFPAGGGLTRVWRLCRRTTAARTTDCGRRSRTRRGQILRATWCPHLCQQYSNFAGVWGAQCV